MKIRATSQARAVEFIAHVLDHWELLEHGISIGFAWPTERGELLLTFLKEQGTDTQKWPEWVYDCECYKLTAP